MKSQHRLRTALLVASLAASWTMPAFADQSTSIANGDTAALVAALQQANQSSGVTTIVLAQRGAYAAGVEFPALTGAVILEGRGATLRQVSGASASSGRFLVSPSGSATVREITFTGYVAAPLETSGRLTVESVALVANTPTGFGISGQALIATRFSGQLVATNVTIANNSTAGNQQFLGFIYNQGRSELRHITIAGNQRGSTATGTAGPYAIFNEAQASAVLLANSLLVNDGIIECVRVTSLGGNVFDDSSCGTTSSDVIATAGVVGALDSSGLVPIVPVLSGGVAVDRGRVESCTARDAIGTPRLGAGGAAGCDAGAHELRSQSPLSQDGMNGVYFGANNDGQYVSIQRLSPTTALVVWYGFDRAGRNTWIFGVGEIAGTRVTVNAFQQTGGTLGTDSVVRGSQVTPFGTLLVDLTSCQAGTLDYSSTLPAFGSGRVPLRRLTVTHNLGCAAL